MKIVRSINSCRLPVDGCVLTIGNFDGVHLGHQKIINQLVSAGNRLQLPTVVMTFEPGPDEYFQGDRAAPRITSVGTRYFILKEQGIDVMLVLPFNRRLAQTSATSFIDEFLLQKLKVKHVLVGDDFRFGQGRKGDFSLLKKRGETEGFEVENFQTVTMNDARVSSTRVREHLRQGDLKTVRNLLGRNMHMVGRVTHGDKRGRQWGFPTLNLPVSHKLPMTGVFAVRVVGAVLNNTVHGVANLGKRPTVDGLKTLLEVHLFDFKSEIYGNRICVEFVHKIRDEKKFHSFDDLKAQITKDCGRARKILCQQRSNG